MTTRPSHIAIVGSGEIGSRHLQALSRINRDIQISVVDPNVRCLKIAERRFMEMPVNRCVKNVQYFSSLADIDNDIDVAIVATNADIRREIVEQVLQGIPTRYFIMEKVAFQSVSDFEFVITLLQKSGSDAWVNCPRRMYPFYRKLRREIGKGEKIIIDIDMGPSTGGDSGLACNAIHHLDLFSFLTGETSILIDNSGLNPELIETRRRDYIELSGRVSVTTPRGDFLKLVYQRQTNRPSLQTFSSRRCRYLVFQLMGKVIYQKEDDEWALREEEFIMPKQSELTHLVVQDLLNTGSCLLTPIKSSFKLHRPMLTSFINHLESTTGKKYEKCPIT